MKRGFLIRRSEPLAEPSPSSAEQPASTSSAVQPALSFTQPASSAEQPANLVRSSGALRSVADVHSWLEINAAALGSSPEAMRIKDAVSVLKVKPSPRREVVENTSGLGTYNRGLTKIAGRSRT